MHKLFVIILVTVFLFSFFSCTTIIQMVRPGSALKEENGYILISFVNKVELFSIGSKNVYFVLRQLEKDQCIYLPFGSGGKLRLIAVPAGTYRIEPFVYEGGIASVQGDSSVSQPGVMTRKPERLGMRLEKTNFNENIQKEFTINTGELVYLGDYAWEVKLAFGKPAVKINRSMRSEDAIQADLREEFSIPPGSLRLVSLPE